MRCVIILAGLVISAASSPVSDIISPKINVLSKNPLLLSRHDKNWHCFEKPHKAINRKRRSMKTRFINDIDTAVETFHMKPLLAKGINDDNKVGNKLKKTFYDSKNLAKYWSTKDAGQEIVVESKYSLSKLRPLFPTVKPVPLVDEQELQTLKNEVKYLDKMVKMSDNREKELMDYLKNVGKISENELVGITVKGPNHYDTNDCFAKILTDKPQLKARVVEDTKYINNMRQQIKSLAEDCSKYPVINTNNPDPELKNLKRKIMYILRLNNHWLYGTPPPNFLPHVVYHL